MIKSYLLLSVILALSVALCPDKCACSYDNSFKCSLCLSDYFRSYTIQGNACTCLDSYVEMLPPQDSCRPASCLTYTSNGCGSCRTNWVRSLNEGVNYVCECNKNYELDVNGSCVCSSNTYPESFYGSTIQGYCKVCPYECTCSSLGCYECSPTANRRITQEGGVSLCECAPPYVQIKGGCGVYQKCTISLNGAGQSVMNCSSDSLRQQQPNGTWSCISPYTDMDGQCWCDGLHSMLSIYQDKPAVTACVCLSTLYPSQFTEFMGVCAACPKDCYCSSLGCVSCLTTANRQILGIGCPCLPPYIEIQSQCVCTEPYFLADVGGSMTCTCLNLNYPNLFYSDYDTGACWKCPNGCICNESGCNSCNAESLRLVETKTGTTLHQCSKCDWTATLIDDACVCPPLSVYSNGKCACQVGPNVYTNLQDSRKCIPCPSDCTCSALLGCSACLPTANRNVVLAGAYSICPCMTGFAEDSGKCSCALPYTLNKTGICVCDSPYELVGIVCQCKSVRAPTQYYYDSLEKMCYPCPPGCSCSSLGCVSCSSDALRVIATTSGGTICPCKQTAVFDGVTCTYCSNSSMVVNGQCIPCLECATCNILGCTSCRSDAMLVNSQCICINPSFSNINGVCMCSIEKVQNASSSLCVDCPKQCKTCLINTSGKFQCTSCRSGVNRFNAVGNNCPCEDQYKESSPIELFCCPTKCKTCDNLGCLTCSSISNRVLSGRDCVCMPTYVDVGNGMCGCPSRTVDYGGTCINCPAHCLQCSYNATSKSFPCTSCAANVNRDVNSPTCECLPDFSQAVIHNIYCAPAYCLSYDPLTGKCIKCVDTRELDNRGWCLCPAHYYAVGPTGSYGLCRKCGIVIEGCIDCTSRTRCLVCDATQGYYLIAAGGATICKTSNTNQSNLLYAQAKDGVIIQIKLSIRSSEFPIVKSVIATSYSVYTSAPSSTGNSNVSLPVQSSRKLGNDVLEIKISNPDTRSQNQLLEINYTLINYTTRYLSGIIGVDPIGEFDGIEESAYTYQPLVYANADVTQGNSWQYILANIVVVVLMLASLAIYMLGFKHNQLLFFLQTMALLAYNIDIKLYYSQTTFLYALKGAYYQFGQQPSIFSIPDGYLESSFGNFSYFETDGNIFRVADILLVLTFTVGAIIAILRTIYYRLKSISIIGNLSKRTKKWIYRALEFFYKTCMYPLLFFSLVNLRNWNSTALVGSNNFKNVSICISILLIVGYASVTLWQWLGQTTAKVNKIENVSEFATSFLAAIILVWTIQRDLYLLLIIVFCIRGAVYLASRRMLLRDFVKPDYMKGACVILEVISLFLIRSSYIESLVTFIFLTTAVQIAHQIVVLVLDYEHGRLDKIIQQTIADEEPPTSFSDDTIVIMSRTAKVFPIKEAQVDAPGESHMRILEACGQQSLVQLEDDEKL